MRYLSWIKLSAENMRRASRWMKTRQPRYGAGNYRNISGPLVRMRLFTSFLAITLLTLLGASFAGALHPAGDSLAVFRLPLAVACGLAVVWTPWGRAVRWPLAAACLAVLGWHGWMARAALPDEAGATAVYQKNLSFRSGDKGLLVADLSALAPDHVTLQEVNDRNLPLLAQLEAAYPSQVLCPFSFVGGVAVLSRHPLVAESAICAERDGLAAMQVQAPGGPVWVVSIHLHWPWPHGQASQIDRLLPLLETLDGKVIIGADFNAVAWSHAVTRIERASGTRRLGPHMATFVLPRVPLGIGIDHVLASAPDGAATFRRARLGSDHYGILARIPRN